MQLITLTGSFRILILIFTLTVTSCSTSNWQRATRSGNNEAQFIADIAHLADDRLEGRAFGTDGELKAGDYIARRFKLLDLQPMGENGSWYQIFTVKNPSPHGVEFSKSQGTGSLTGRNVLAFLDHGAPFTIVLGAHYDHLGMGNMGSLHMGEPAIHNGADDNASGVAMILELAERLKHVKKFNYVFAAFTGEENGLWGSNYFCDHPTIDLSTVTAMLNFDMVGRLNRSTKKMALNGTGTSPAWPQLIQSANTYGLDFTMTESGIGPSDHTSFYLEDIPAIHFFTGAHEDYHKPSDDVHLINASGMDVIASMVVSLINLMDPSAKLEFSKTKDPDPSTTPRMEVTLGVLPDYLYDGKGMRIDGVREGKPAEVAGLTKGDIIIRMDGKNIADIYAYMDVLGTFHKGDIKKVTVLREDKELTFEVKF